MTDSLPASDQDWARLDAETGCYPIKRVWITDDRDQPVGLLLVDDSLAVGDIRPLLAAIASRYPQRTELPATLRLPELAQPTQELQKELAHLKELAQTDLLTGIANYSHFLELLTAEIDRVGRTRLPCALIMLDVDHFKAINDNYGHETGNLVLRAVAERIKHNIRKIDIPARYGGEEFAVILPATGTTTAMEVAERLLAAIRKTQTIRDGVEIEVTASIGVAVCTPFALLTPAALIRAADEQLYRAKETGRNRICFVSTSAGGTACQVTADERAQLFNILRATDKKC